MTPPGEKGEFFICLSPIPCYTVVRDMFGSENIPDLHQRDAIHVCEDPIYAQLRAITLEKKNRARSTAYVFNFFQLLSTLDNSD
jgi:hypothetical protein